jgi:RNA polymerase sigma factor (sigma-70 family)
MYPVMQNIAATVAPEFPLLVAPLAEPSQERDRRIREALPLVRSIADRLRRRYTLSMPFEDLCAFGVTGLVRAMGRFDPSRQASFSTYAYHRIRGAMLDGLRRSDRQYSFDMRRRLAAERRSNEYLAAESAVAS